MSSSFRETFLDKVCPWEWAFGLIFMLNVVLLVLLGLTYYVGSPSTQSTVVSAMALVFILATLIILAPLIRFCRSREKHEFEWDDEDGSDGN